MSTHTAVGLRKPTLGGLVNELRQHEYGKPKKNGSGKTSKRRK